MCCKGGALRFLPLLPPAPKVLAELLTGFVADDYQLEHPPHTLAACLTSERVSGDLKVCSDHFQQHIRRYNSAISLRVILYLTILTRRSKTWIAERIHALHGTFLPKRVCPE